MPNLHLVFCIKYYNNTKVNDKKETTVSAPIYYIKDGYLSFGAKTLLANAEIYIKREDRICLIGRNGCGKSSLMKIINGQYELDTGTHYMEPGTKVGYLPVSYTHLRAHET